MSRRSADRLAHTAVMAVANTVRVETMQRDSEDILKGWRFVATLERHTCVICAALDGKVFALNDPEMPRPPRHPGCRCTLVPVVKSFRDMGIDLDDLPGGTRPATTGTKVEHVPANEAYADWFKRQPASFQREVLGETRYQAYRRGVPLEGFATYSRELSIDELRRLYPEAMADA